jgi:hypothetical protein
VPGPSPTGRVALSTHPDRDGQPVGGSLELDGDEGVVVECESGSPAPTSIS